MQEKQGFSYLDSANKTSHISPVVWAERSEICDAGAAWASVTITLLIKLVWLFLNSV